MKILFLTRRFYPEIGGVERHVLEISKELIKKGHKITVICEGKGNEEFEKINIYRIPITVGEKLKKFQIWFWFFKNLHLIKEADIIHCHDVFFWILPFRLFLPFKKIFTTFHGYEGVNSPGVKKIFQHKLAEIFSQGNLCIGDFYRKWYYTKPTLVSFGAANWEYSKQNEVYDLCFMGRLAEDTGILVYLKAYKILKQKGLHLKMLVGGEGPLFDKSKKFAKDNQLRIDFSGWVKNPKEYIGKCKFAFVSRYLGIIEAMQSKKLIFAVYNNEIKKDYLIKSPFAQYIIIEKDPLVLSKKIQFYLNHKAEAKSMIDKAYIWAREQTWEKMANLYLELWGSKR